MYTICYVDLERERSLVRKKNGFLNSFTSGMSKGPFKSCALPSPRKPLLLPDLQNYRFICLTSDLISGKIQMPLERSHIEHYQSFYLYLNEFSFQPDPVLFHKRYEAAYWAGVEQMHFWDQIWWKPMVGRGKAMRRTVPPIGEALCKLQSDVEAVRNCY